MILKSALAAMIATGLIVPEKPKLVFPKPAIVKRENLEFWNHSPLLGMPLTLGMLPSKRAAFNLTYVSNFRSGSAASSYTGTSQNLGSLVSSGNTRYIVICTHGCANSTAGQISSVTIGGNAATRQYQISASQGRPTEIWTLLNNSLTSGNVVVTTSTQQFAFGFSVWILVNPSSPTPAYSAGTSFTSTTTGTLSFVMPAGGIGLALHSVNNSAGAFGSWTNATLQYSALQASGAQSGARVTSAGTFNVTSTWTNSSNVTRVHAAWT
jgi:hypothetical protein